MSSTPKSPPADLGSVARAATAKKHRDELDYRDDQIKRLTAAYHDAQRQLGVAIEVERHAATPVVIAADSTKSGSGEATAFAVWSDWHVEERIRPETVSGLNSFDLDEAGRRIGRLTSGVLRLTEIERHGIRIDKLVLVLGGDFMTGYIHEELVEDNSLAPVEAIVWLRDRILSVLRVLRERGQFKKIVAVCCYGNHGRTTQKPRVSTGATNNYEWLLYQVLAKHAPEIEWHIAEGYHTFLDIYGRAIRVHHGDGLRYQGGIGGLTIPVEKAIAAWNKARAADLDIFGHWHTQMQNPKWCSNGSLIGYGPFSVQIKAPFEPPQQTYFLFDAKRGRTATWPIVLT